MGARDEVREGVGGDEVAMAADGEEGRGGFGNSRR